jgi:hypothetical protein
MIGDDRDLHGNPLVKRKLGGRGVMSTKEDLIEELEAFIKAERMHLRWRHGRPSTTPEVWLPRKVLANLAKLVRKMKKEVK